MDIRNFEDILKLQQSFAEQLAARMQTLATSAMSGVVDPVGERRAQLEDAEQKMAAIAAAREAAYRRFDDEITRQRTRAEGLQRELNALDAARRDAEGQGGAAAAGDAAGPPTPDVGDSEAPPKPPGRTRTGKPK
jgi:phage-related minor tail protein